MLLAYHRKKKHKTQDVASGDLFSYLFIIIYLKKFDDKSKKTTCCWWCHLTSSKKCICPSAVLFPEKHECLGTHCSLIEQEKKEDSSCQISYGLRQEERQRKEVGDLLVLSRPAKSLQNGAGFSRKNLNLLGLPKRKEWP